MKFVTTLIIVIIVLAGGYYFFFTTPDDDVPDDDTVVVINEPDTPEEVQKYFNEQLQEGVIERIGQPIHGFVPSMFIEAFSGIVPQDFDGTDALLGKYEIVEKELVFIMDEGGPIHSAAETLSEEGMKTLFSNIANRAGATRDKGALFTTEEEISGLLLFLGAPPVLTSTSPSFTVTVWSPVLIAPSAILTSALLLLLLTFVLSMSTSLLMSM